MCTMAVGGRLGPSLSLHTRVLPWRAAAQAPRHPRLPADARVLAFAVSFQGQKVFVVNLDTGAISVNNDRSVFLPAAPPDSVPGARDGVLRWFEEYAERLGTGMYTYCGLDEELPAYRGICLFPQQPPQVRVSTTHACEASTSKNGVVAAPNSLPVCAANEALLLW